MIEKAPNDEALRARFQKTFVGYQQIVNAEQQKVVQQINGLMQKTLEDFRTKNGYSVIMNAEAPRVRSQVRCDQGRDRRNGQDQGDLRARQAGTHHRRPEGRRQGRSEADAKPEAKK